MSNTQLAMTRLLKTRKSKFHLDISPKQTRCRKCGEKIEEATGNMTPYQYRCGCRTWGKNEYYRG